MQPYNEALVSQTIDAVADTYQEAGADTNRYAAIWPVRVQREYDEGKSWAAAEANQLRLLRRALGLAPPVIVPDPPRGNVRLVNGAFHDDRGAFNALGASLFAAPWAWKHDRTRLLENARLLASASVDYVRVFGQVASGGDWNDRVIDPDWTDYQSVMADMIDAFFAIGLRTHITVLAGAGGEGAQTPDRRRRLIDQTLAYANPRRHAIILAEVANEGWNLADAEMRALARRLAENTDIPVAITSCNPDVYLGMREIADLSIMHYDRNVGMVDGYDRPTRQPWGYPGEVYPVERYPDGYATVPQQALDSEGIGPYSSVASDLDPLRNVTRRAVAWICGAPGTTYHAGPGIYFGGQGAQAEHSPANFWEVPGIDDTLQGFRTIKTLMPPGVSGWSRANDQWGNYPWYMRTPVGAGAVESGIGCVRAYCAMSWEQVVCIPFGMRSHIILGERRPMRWTVYHLITGDVLQEGTGLLRLEASQAPAQLVIGKFL